MLLLIGSLQAQIVPTPRAEALPGGGAAHPFLGARHSLQPVELAARGFVEEEFLLKGQGAANSPYITRFLLRRPAPAQFSGRVLVEFLAADARHDTAPLWGLAHEHILRSGDAYVGLTVSAAAIAALRAFDAQRYGALRLVDRDAAACAAGDPAWDAMAQLGALLRSSSRDNPLGRYPVRNVLAGAYSQSAGVLLGFLKSRHGVTRLGDEAPVYDGYLLAAALPVGGPCATEFAPLAPPVIDVPVLQVNTQSEYPDTASQASSAGEALPGNWRHYDLPGIAHEGPWPAGRPGDLDLTALGATRFDAAQACQGTPTTLAANPSYHVLWSWLQRWAEHAQDATAAPPPSRRFAFDAGGVPRLDDNGNAVGGLRLPSLEVPVARYAGSSTTTAADIEVQRACRLSGSVQPWEAAMLKSRYGTRAEFQRRFSAAVEAQVRDGTLLAADAATLKAQAARAQFGP